MRTDRRPSTSIATTLLLLVFLLSYSTPVQAWGPGGHMMVAKIAYDRLNPAAKKQVDKLIALSIKPVRITSQSKNFVDAAHWADDVRSQSDFSFAADLHYVDFPFTTDGTALPGDLPKPRNVLTALTEYVGVLKGHATNAEKAEALRFVIHFVGDIHQPLHCASRVTMKEPDGDLGGNDFHIITIDAENDRHKVKLHSYWDEGLDSFPPIGPDFTPPPLSLIPPAVKIALANNPDTDPDIRKGGPFNYRGWAKESESLAKSLVYKGLTEMRPVPSSYNPPAIKVAETRVAWAGYRLAALLNAIWPG